MVLLFDVHGPDVVVRAEEVLDRQHRGVHGVVLVVVLVHAVAADEVQAASMLVEVLDDVLDVAPVLGVVVRVRLGHAHHEASLDLVRLHEPELLELLGRERDEVIVRGRPELVALEHEVLQSEAGLVVLHHVRRPRAEVLDAADLDLRGVDVDPVVGERGRLGHDERDGEEVAVMQRVAGGADRVGHRRVDRGDEVVHRHRRDHRGRGDPIAAAVGTLDRYGVDDVAGRVHADDTCRHEHLTATGDHEVAASLPHHAGAVLGVLKLLDETRDLLLVPLGEERVLDGVAERESLDALGCPVRRHLVHRHAPDLLGVGLEEVPVEAPPESGDEPVLIVGLVLGRAHHRHDVGQDAADGLDHTEVPERVRRLQRVVVVLALIEDATHAGAHEEVLVREDLVPEVLDGLDLGEEAVPAEVEAPPVALDGPADTSDDVVGLDDEDRLASLHEFVGRGQPGGAGADDDIRHGGSSRAFVTSHSRTLCGVRRRYE